VGGGKVADLADLAVWKVADLNMSDALGAADSDADSQATPLPRERPLHYTTWCAGDHNECQCDMHRLFRKEIVLPDDVIIAMRHVPNGVYHTPFESRAADCAGCEFVCDEWHRWTWGDNCPCAVCAEMADDDDMTDASRESDNAAECLRVPEGLVSMVL